VAKQSLFTEQQKKMN